MSTYLDIDDAVAEHPRAKQELVELRAELERLLALIDCRAGNLLRRGKAFVVVSCTEPYYPHVYRLIREQERHQGTWTDEDESTYRLNLEQYVEAESEGE